MLKIILHSIEIYTLLWNWLHPSPLLLTNTGKVSAYQRDNRKANCGEDIPILAVLADKGKGVEKIATTAKTRPPF